MKRDDLENVKRVLVYKRTHNGDPNEAGEFGCRDCMATVRDRDFDAVIGVGGLSSTRYKMAEKITWIGIQPIEPEEERKERLTRKKRPYSERIKLVNGEKRSTARIVAFKHFLAFRECGYFPPSDPHPIMFTDAPEAPRLNDCAPNIYRKLFPNRRAPMLLDQHDGAKFMEAMSILALAVESPLSPGATDSRARLENTGGTPTKGKGARASCKSGTV